MLSGITDSVDGKSSKNLNNNSVLKKHESRASGLFATSGKNSNMTMSETLMKTHDKLTSVESKIIELSCLLGLEGEEVVEEGSLDDDIGKHAVKKTIVDIISRRSSLSSAKNSWDKSAYKGKNSPGGYNLSPVGQHKTRRKSKFGKF